MFFESCSHQRFENGYPVKGLQICNRAIKIEKNTNGCSGYLLRDGDGYIVTIFNLDGNHPLWRNNVQMSPKPMRLVAKTYNSMTFRGYKIIAQTPFGYNSFDMSDYGITIFIENDEIVKCRLDMFDRNTYIEYYKD